MSSLLPDITEPGRYQIVVDLNVPGSLLRLVTEKDSRVEIKLDRGNLRFRFERVQLVKQDNRAQLLITLEAEQGEFFSTPSLEVAPIVAIILAALSVVGLVSVGYSVKEVRKLVRGDDTDEDGGGGGILRNARELLLIGLAGMALFLLVRRGG